MKRFNIAYMMLFSLENVNIWNKISCVTLYNIENFGYSWGDRRAFDQRIGKNMKRYILLNDHD